MKISKIFGVLAGDLPRDACWKSMHKAKVLCCYVFLRRTSSKRFLVSTCYWAMKECLRTVSIDVKSFHALWWDCHEQPQPCAKNKYILSLWKCTRFYIEDVLISQWKCVHFHTQNLKSLAEKMRMLCTRNVKLFCNMKTSEYFGVFAGGLPVMFVENAQARIKPKYHVATCICGKSATKKTLVSAGRWVTQKSLRVL